ncbi:TorD/DmsD family molecular chaperone [Variovorax sp. VNK109]|uniref:TorD/DmsD family molecular chaperone n=1 Tax=Variovorax sp. VNK109 TaxID=3400919 RepID=UPI003BFF6D4A
MSDSITAAVQGGIPVASALDEETARAEVYGLLAALYYAPPAPELMAQLRVAATEAPAAGGFLEEPWREVVAAARDLSDIAVLDEYDALFGGIGKPEVYLFGSHYLSGFLNEKPLAQLRTDLAALGLARDDAMRETEDHVACICEVMRYLIAGDDVEVANLTRQHEFFSAHVQPWVPALCEALAAHPKARFYRALAGFTQAFVSVEAQGFDMLQ